MDRSAQPRGRTHELPGDGDMAGMPGNRNRPGGSRFVVVDRR